MFMAATLVRAGSRVKNRARPGMMKAGCRRSPEPATLCRTPPPLPENPRRGVAKSGPEMKQPGAQAVVRCGGACAKRR